jgi:hypothetical protein
LADFKGAQSNDPENKSAFGNNGNAGVAYTADAHLYDFLKRSCSISRPTQGEEEQQSQQNF